MPPGTARLLAVAGLCYLALTGIVFRPTPQRLVDSILLDAGDPLFVAWCLEWVAHAAERGFSELGSPPIFYPLRGALWLSDHMVNPGLLAAALPSSLPRGVLLFNLAALASFPASGLATAFVLRRSGLPPFAAAVGGLIFAWAPFRLAHLTHLALLLAQWIPLLLWSWDRLLATRRRRYAVCFVALYALHVSGGVYLAYMAHVPLAVVALVRLHRHRRELLRRAALRVLVPVAVACTLLAALVFGPYVLHAQRLGTGRSVSETVSWGATSWSYLTPAHLNRYAELFPDRHRRPENELFAGFLPTALAGLGLAALIARRPLAAARRSRSQRLVLGFLAAQMVAALLLADRFTLEHTRRAAWGVLAADTELPPAPTWLLLATLIAAIALRRRWRPAGGTWWNRLSAWERGLLASTGLAFLLTFPFVFVPLSKALPGLSGMRVPSRFYPFVSLGIAWLAAHAVAAGAAALRRPGARAALGTSLLLLLLWELTPSAVPWMPIPSRPEQFPAAHRWLAAHRGEVTAYLELPLADVRAEIRGMYYQTLHWVPSVNGYSGYFPDPHGLRRCCADAAIAAPEIERLRRAGVSHLLISGWKMEGEEPRPERAARRAAARERRWRACARRLVRQGLAVERFRGDGTRVLELRPPPPEGSAGADATAHGRAPRPATMAHSRGRRMVDGLDGDEGSPRADVGAAAPGERTATYGT